MNGLTGFYNVVEINPDGTNDIFVSGLIKYTTNVIPNPGCLFSECQNKTTLPGSIGIQPTSFEKSSDGGQNWDILAPPSSGFAPLITDLATDAAGTNIYISTVPYSTPVYLFAGGEGIYKSSDGGTNWNSVNNFTEGYDASKLIIPSITVHPQKPEVIFASMGRDGVLGSIDGGLNWELLHGLPPNVFFSRIGIAGKKLFAMTSNGIYAANHRQRYNLAIKATADAESNNPIVDYPYNDT